MNSSLPNTSANPAIPHAGMSLNSPTYQGFHYHTPPHASPDDDVSLTGYLAILFDHWRLLLGLTLLGVALALLASFLIKPVYESSLLIHVEEDSQKEAKNLLGELGAMFQSKTAAPAEIELLRSRLVISRAIDNLHLTVAAQPRYFPLIGAWIAERNRRLSTPGLFGFGGYAWGAERIDVGQFDVPEALQNLPFILTAERDGQYRVRLAEKDIDLRGRIGTPLVASTVFGELTLRVNQISAQSGAQFTLQRFSRLAVMERIQQGLTVVELGKQSGVISATLQGDDAALVGSELREIGREYVLQHAFRKTEEAQKSLALIEQQLPELRTQLELAETRLNSYRNVHGTIDLGEEARLTLQQSAAARLRKLDLEQKRTELLNRFTSDHPAVIGINNQLREINNELRTTADQIRGLPSVEQEVLRLQRDVKVNTDLYTALLNTSRQLRLVTLGKASNVRLIDSAVVPEKPVWPNRPKMAGVGLVLGFLLGVLAIFMRRTLKGTLEDPAEIEKLFGVPVAVTIPHSRMQAELADEVSTKSKRLPLLARAASADIAVESLRNFRAALQYALVRAKNNIVLVASPTAGIGKTFVSVNMAVLLATSGKKVLLIDADFRNGHLHRYFELARQSGLADFLSGGARMEQVIYRNVLENLDFIPTGSLPSNPAELLLRPALGHMLRSLSEQYDVIMIDATPVLPVADTLIIGAHAASIYLLTRAGITTPGEIDESIKRLLHAGLVPSGILFNDLKTRPGRYGYGYRYGRYRHSPYLLSERPMIEVSPA